MVIQPGNYSIKHFLGMMKKNLVARTPIWTQRSQRKHEEHED